MIELKGIAHNIEKSILGRISHESTLQLKRKDVVLVFDTLPKLLRGYAAVLIGRKLDEALKNITVPICHNVNNIDSLKDGDVVLIKPDGLIMVLYQIDSGQNAIFATEQCNFSCIMCPQDTTKEKDDLTQLNLKLISLFDKKTSNIAITGGEPTLIGDDLILLLEQCKKFIPKASITILTNGLRFNDFDYVKKIAAVCHKNLTIAIPLYADTDTGHNNIVKTKSFYAIIQGLYNLALFNLKVEIRTVVTAVNYKRLPMLAEFIYHNTPFVVHVAIMGMETRGLARQNIENIWVDPYDYTAELDTAVTYLNQRWLNVSIYNHQLCLLPKKLWPFAKQSISTWKNIYLEECEVCCVKKKCCGFFASSKDIHSQHIRAVINEV